MRIAVTGAGGQLGAAVSSLLQQDAVPLTHADVEICDAASVESALARASADAVINTAACNQVDRGEDEPAVAFSVNAMGARNLAVCCHRLGIPLLHVSTDYVFCGFVDAGGQRSPRSVPYREDDVPAPLSAYAVSKLAGEHFVRGLCRRHFIVRTCGLYGSGGGNFVETMLKLSAERDEVGVVDDQTCTPTLASDLAEWLVRLIQTDRYGLYHGTNSGQTTWCGLAREVFRLSGKSTGVRAITTAEYAARAARPGFSVLECKKLERTLGTTIRPWQQALADCLSHRARS